MLATWIDDDDIYIYIPGQKYKTTLKNEEKCIVYNF